MLFADDTSVFACTNERNISLKKKLCGVKGTLYRYGGVAARRRDTKSPPESEAGLFRVDGSPVVVVMFLVFEDEHWRSHKMLKRSR